MKLPIWDWQILNQTNLPWRPLSIWNLPHTLSSWKLLMLWGPKSIDFNNFQFLWGVSFERKYETLFTVHNFVFFMKIRKKWVLSRYSISISLRNARQPADSPLLSVVEEIVLATCLAMQDAVCCSSAVCYHAVCGTLQSLHCASLHSIYCPIETESIGISEN